MVGLSGSARGCPSDLITDESRSLRGTPVWPDTSGRVQYPWVQGAADQHQERGIQEREDIEVRRLHNTEVHVKAAKSD
jgi:hypothetical protein